LTQPDIFSKHQVFLRGFLFFVLDDFIDKNRKVIEEMKEYTNAQFSKKQLTDSENDILEYVRHCANVANDIIELRNFWNIKTLYESDEVIDEMAIRLIKHRNELDAWSFNSSIKNFKEYNEKE